MTVALENLTLSDIVKNDSFFATILAGFRCLQKHCPDNIAEAFPEHFTGSEGETIPAPEKSELEDLIEAFNFAAGSAMGQTVITIERGVPTIADNPTGAEILFIDYDQFRHGDSSLMFPETQVSVRHFEWLKLNHPTWVDEQLDRESAQSAVEKKGSEALEALRCEQAILDLTAKAEYKPTQLLHKLAPPFWYDLVQSTLSKLLETGAIVANPKMILINRRAEK